LQATIRRDDVATVSAIVHAGQDRELLRLLRDEATTVVLMVRLENEARQEEWRQAESLRQKEEDLVSEWLATDGLFGEGD
jgi:predicted component of type VI protein secretion system